MAANHISPEKVVGSFFNRASRSADISGKVPSDHSVTQKGRRGRRTNDKVKVHHDEQFTGRAYQVSTADASCVKGSVSFGVGNNDVGTLSIWFKLNSMNDGVIFHGVYDYVKLAGSGTQIKIAGNTNSGGTPALFDIPPVQINQWYHLVVFLDGINDEAKVWLNSIESTSGQQSIIPELSSLLRIGIYNGISSINLDGYIAHVGKWNRELTQDEIEGLYKFDIPTSQIDFYLPLEQSGDDENVFSVVPGANSFTAENFVLGDWVEISDFPYSRLNEKGYNQYFDFNVAKEHYLTSRFAIQDWNGGDLINDFTSQGFLCSGKFSTPGIASSQQVVFSNFIDSGSNSGMFIRLGASGTFEFTIYGESSIGARTFSTALTSSTWDDGNIHEFICWADSDGTDATVRIYIDGVLEKTTVDTDVEHFLWEAIADPFTIGQRLDNGNPIQFFEGKIWDIRLFKAKRYTQSDIDDFINTHQSLNPYLYKHWELLSDPESNKDWQPTGDWLTVPGSLLSDTKDVLGTDLFYKNKLAPRLQLVNAPAVKLNGVDQLISANINSASISSITLSTRFNAQGTLGSIISASNGLGKYIGIYLLANQELQVYRRSSLTTELGTNTGVIIDLNQWYEVSLLVNDDDSFILIIDNTEYRFDALSAMDFSEFSTSLIKFSLGSLESVSMLDVTLCDARLYFDSDLKIHYPLSEGNGAMAYDVSGNSLHSAIAGAVLPDIWETQDDYHCNYFQGYQSIVSLNGIDQSIGFPETTGTSGDHTFLFRVRMDASGLDYSCIASGVLTLFRWHTTDNALRLRGHTNSGSETIFTFPSSIRTGDWQTIVLQKRNSDSFCRVLINGVENVEGYQGTLSATSIRFDSLGEGSSRWTKGEYAFFGKWNRLLTDTEMSNFSTELPALTGINRLYTFDESSGNMVRDKSGNEQHATLENITSRQKLPIKLTPYFVPGYETKGIWNGASDIQLPDIPEMPGDLRGKAFTQNEVGGLVYAGRVLNSNKDLAVFREKAESIHFQRKGSGLILDDYPATCPSTALQKIHSDFTGNILTVRNEDNLQDASFGFDQYGRLPEADIVEHLNGTANGRVTSYNFQNVNHVGVGYTQTVLAEMPYIAKNGVIQRDSRGLPALRFDGAQSLAYESQTAFKPMHDGTRGVQLIGFQVDEGQSDFWLVGNTDFQGQVGFEFFGDVFNLDKAHFIVRTNTANSAILDLDIPMLVGEYNRMVNYIDPANLDAIERHTVLVNELERAANAYTEMPDVGNTEDGTTSVGALGIRKMEGYINELIFIGDHKADMLKLSRSLMFMP